MARLLSLLLLVSTSVEAADNNWPRFRGHDGTGVAPDHDGLPLTWTTSENVKWVADIPGWGWSCPVVWGDRVFLTTVVSDKANLTPSKGLYLGQGVREPAKGTHHWLVCCFDLKTGKELWKHEAHTGQPKVPRHPKSTYAAETPTTDGKRLYVLFGDVGLYCYDLEGKQLWSQPIEPQKTFMDYGAAASPVVHDGQVFVVYDNFKESWIASFDAATGKEKWRTARDETHSWATPLVWQNDVRTEIVVPGKKRNRGYSLDGKVLWEFNGRMSNLVIPSPFVAHNLCYIASGYIGDNHRPTFAIRPGAAGDLAPEGDFTQNEQIAWYQKQASSYNPTQIVYGNYLYTLYDRGFLTCQDARTGEEVYGKRRFDPRGSFTSSPWAYNGHLFFLSEDGLTYVVKAGSEFEIVGTNNLKELCLSSPAVSGENLLIRTGSSLYCLTKGAQLPPEIVAQRMKKAAAPDLFDSARHGRLKDVASALEAGKSVNAQNGNGMTPLMLASLYSHKDVVGLLLEKDADVTASNFDGNTALHMAAFVARPTIVEMLLKRGASAEVKNKRGETPLGSLSAEWSGQLEATYKRIGTLIGEDFDLNRIKKSRPVVLALLKESVADKQSDIFDVVAPESVDLDGEKLSEIDKLMQSEVDSGRVAGCLALIARGEKVAYFKTWGHRDREKELAMTDDTIFRIYSMSKPITSVAIMQLVEQGKLKLDDPVSKYLPSLKELRVLVGDSVDETEPAKKEITVRDLLRHTSGLTYGFFGNTPVDRAYRQKRILGGNTIEQTVEKLGEIPLLYQPGTRWHYSVSTDVLGRLVEVASGEQFDKYLSAHIFKPLKMTDTFFTVPEDRLPRLAQMYAPEGRNKLKPANPFESLRFVTQTNRFFSGGGGLCSTTRDYLRFCQALLNSGELEGQRILKAETIREMTTDQLKEIESGNFKFGLGFAIGSEGEFSWGGAAGTRFWINPKRNLIAIHMIQIKPFNRDYVRPLKRILRSADKVQ